MAREDHRYCAFYCEENVWQLIGDLPEPSSAEAWLITNPQKTVATWGQRASQHEEAPVVWDYHVVLATFDPDHARVWDFDHRGPFVQSARDWLAASFPRRTEADFAPHFRCVPAAFYREHFSSDRSHMHAPGRKDLWLADPPPWPRIGEGRPNTLMEWLDCERRAPGRWYSLPQLRARV